MVTTIIKFCSLFYENANKIPFIQNSFQISKFAIRIFLAFEKVTTLFGLSIFQIFWHLNKIMRFQVLRNIFK